MKKIRVFIIDNDRASGRLKFLLESEIASTSENTAVEVICGSNASRVWESFMENPFYFDVLIVNCDLGEVNEDRLVTRLEDLKKINPLVILFLSTGSRFLPVRILDCGIAGILSKPYERKRIRTMLRHIERHRKLLGEEPFPLFPLSRGGVLQRLYVPDILYGRKIRGGMRLVTEDGDFFYRVGIEDFERRGYRFFCRSHNSYIVNIRYVKRMEYGGFLLENGEFIPISRTYRQNVREYLKSGGFAAPAPDGETPVPAAAGRNTDPAEKAAASPYRAAEQVLEYDGKAGAVS